MRRGKASEGKCSECGVGALQTTIESSHLPKDSYTYTRFTVIGWDRDRPDHTNAFIAFLSAVGIWTFSNYGHIPDPAIFFHTPTTEGRLYTRLEGRRPQG